MLINHKRMLGYIVCSLLLLGGCTATHHPMTKMIRMQRDMMQDMADILHRVDDVSDIEPAVRQMEQLTARMQRRTMQVSQSMGPNDIPTSQAEVNRLQSAMEHEMKGLEPVMKQIEKEMARLAKKDWAAPLLDAAKKYEVEFNYDSK